MSNLPSIENSSEPQNPPPKKRLKRKIEEMVEPSLFLTRKELIYFRSLPLTEQLLLNTSMESLKKFTDDPEIPLKFHILKLPVSEFIKSNVMKKIQALDEHGEMQTYEADGLMAVCIQHEMDHLMGKVFVEYLSLLKRTRIRGKLIKAQRELER